MPVPEGTLTCRLAAGQGRHWLFRQPAIGAAKLPLTPSAPPRPRRRTRRLSTRSHGPPGYGVEIWSPEGDPQPLEDFGHVSPLARLSGTPRPFCLEEEGARLGPTPLRFRPRGLGSRKTVGARAPSVAPPRQAATEIEVLAAVNPPFPCGEVVSMEALLSPMLVGRGSLSRESPRRQILPGAMALRLKWAAGIRTPLSQPSYGSSLPLARA
jgi:hypothetical protein